MQQKMVFEARMAEPRKAVPYSAEFVMEEPPTEQAKSDEVIIRLQLAKYGVDLQVKDGSGS